MNEEEIFDVWSDRIERSRRFWRRLAIALIILVVLLGARCAFGDSKCPLCSCAMPYDKCAKVCTLERRQKDTCDMQCKDACMHKNPKVYCPKRVTPKS